MKIKTTHAVYANDNGHTLTPYVSCNGEIWLASEGNGCGDDVMLEDIGGWTDAEICERWGDINLDALRADAAEIRAAGDADNADWIEDWCRTCERARKPVRYATIDARKDGRGDEFTSEYDSEQAAVDAAERDWNHLTPSEQAVRTICAVKSVATDDVEFDWGAYDVVKEFKA